MQVTRAVGRAAAARKYDLLTALGAYALDRGGAEERLVLRLITLVVARYNWAREELAVGQREIGRLWNVDPRTVKREMAKLRAMGWLTITRRGARGRVSEYRLELFAIFETTRPVWPAVGPDFVARLDDRPEPTDARIVPFPARGAPPPDISDGDEWSLAAAVLYAEDAGLYGAWIAALRRSGRAGGRLTLHAPSRFHAAYVTTHLNERLLRACQSVDNTVSEITVVA
ncbi:MAG: hypothetical protein AAF667_18335 [Pseudomonadota bacterium]